MQIKKFNTENYDKKNKKFDQKNETFDNTRKLKKS